MIRILDNLHQRLGYEEISEPRDFISGLQQEAARWACAFGSFECRSAIYFKLKIHLVHKTY